MTRRLREQLSKMSYDELSGFIVGTFEWSDPSSPDFPESMALVDAELLRRAKRGEDWHLPGILEDWEEREIPPSVPELAPLLKWATRRVASP